tara:strand:+ start:1027 stop:1365 length:339 start_codon:yes stop_codon:yes gene_type:complete
MQCSNCGNNGLKKITKQGETCECKSCGAEFTVQTSADHRPAVVYMSRLPKPNIGGKREGAGRPAPLGRKEVCSVRLTPDVAEFCRQHPEGFTVLEKKLRASKEFREWLKVQK